MATIDVIEEKCCDKVSVLMATEAVYGRMTADVLPNTVYRTENRSNNSRKF